MYRDHILAWVLGVFDRIKGGARRNMESEKFTEIFEEELGLTKAFLDADIGGRFAESFVISIRTNVSTGDPPEQKLAHVGTIRWNGETVIWIVDDELKARRPLLSEFVKKNTPDSRVLGQIKYLFEEHRPVSDPFPGLPLLSSLGQVFFSASGLQDSKKIDTAWDFACLVVHDAIACGAGIELGSVGHFHSGFTFDPDQMLIDTITALRKIRTNRQTGETIFRARRLNIRSS